MNLKIVSKSPLPPPSATACDTLPLSCRTAESSPHSAYLSQCSGERSRPVKNGTFSGALMSTELKVSSEKKR